LHSYSFSFIFIIIIDPTWGVDGFYKTSRKEAAKFTLKYYDQSNARLSNPIRLGMITSYDRCKANRRCNWGIVELDQYTNDATFYQRLFDRGKLSIYLCFLIIYSLLFCIYDLC